LAAASKVVVKRARELVPKPGYAGDKPGLKPLRETIGHTVKTYGQIFVAIIGPQRPAGAHGHLVERDVKAHIIVASAYSSTVPHGRYREKAIARYASMTRKKALASAKILYGRSVKHPGSTGQHFLERSSTDTRQQQQQAITESIDRAIQKATGNKAT
jgi:hypothetical protein